MKNAFLSLCVLLCAACAPNVHAVIPTPLEQGPSLRVDASPTCEGAVARAGHLPTPFCTAEVDYFCADALLKAGHSPALLPQCQNVNGICAASQINARQPLTEIAIRCRM
ncbi:MAG: hypothetical protein AB8H86_29385 [Polyangiales bacterium]